METQSDSGWKGPMKTIHSNCLLKGWSTDPGYSGAQSSSSYLQGWRSTACLSNMLQYFTMLMVIFFHSRVQSGFALAGTSGFCLSSFPWAPLRMFSPQLLQTFPLDSFRQQQDPLLSFGLMAEQTQVSQPVLLHEGLQQGYSKLQMLREISCCAKYPTRFPGRGTTLPAYINPAALWSSDVNYC